MKKPGAARRIIAGFFAIIFCLIFIVMAIATPVATSALNVLNGKSIENIVEKTDFTDVLGEAIEELDMEEAQKAFIRDFLDSKTAGTIIEKLTGNIVATIKGEQTFTIDEAYIKSVLEENDSEIDSLLKSAYPEITKAPAKQYAKAKAEFKNELTEIFTSMIPDVKEFLSRDFGYGTIAEMQAMLVKIASVLVAVLAILAVIIICLKLYRGNGFVWLASALVIPTIVCLALAAADINSVEAVVTLPIESSMMGLANSIFGLLLAPIKTFAYGYLIAIVLCVVLKIIIAKSCNKKLAEAGVQKDPEAGDYSYKTVEDEPKDNKVE